MNAKIYTKSIEIFFKANRSKGTKFIDTSHSFLLRDLVTPLKAKERFKHFKL